MIQIIKIDESFMQVVAEPSVRMGLSEHFTRYAEGYQFSPKYKNGIWDGKIRLFKYSTGVIYSGLLKEVIKYLQDDGQKFKVDKDLAKCFCSRFNEEEIVEFAESINLNAYGSKIEHYDFQIDAIKRNIQMKRGIILSPTSSGKSSVIYTTTRFILENEIYRGDKILIVVPDLTLMSQLKNDFIDYSKLNGWEAESHIGTYSGLAKEIEKTIIISTWQSIFKKPKDFFNSFKAVIIDEVHKAKSASIISVMEKCSYARYRIGLTGSLSENELDALTIIGLFGPIRKMISTKELQERKLVASMKILCIGLKYKKHPKKIEYQKEIDFLCEHEERNNRIIDLVSTLEGNTLVLVSRVEKHGKPLFEKSKAAGNKSRLIFGSSKLAEREQLKAMAERETGLKIFATYQIFSTGVSIRNLHNIVFASPSKSIIRILQSLGRGLRISATKTHCDVYDFFDMFSNNKNPNFSAKHFFERMRIYSAEEFDFEIIDGEI